MIATADLCDAHPDKIRIAQPLFRDFGGKHAFHGPCATVKALEDNTLVRAALEEAGGGRVLVVDGGGSLRCALVGDVLAGLAESNGWTGIVVYGCIRDAQAISQIPVGVKALNTFPQKSEKRGTGQRQVVAHFAGITIHPGDYIYADADGLLVAAEDLTAG